MLIGELAKAAGVSKDTVRHYDELGLLLAGERIAGSRIYREYSNENITRIKMIRSAKEMGFTLSEVRKLTQDYDRGKMSDTQVIELLEEKLKVIRGKISALRQIEDLVQGKLNSLK